MHPLPPAVSAYIAAANAHDPAAIAACFAADAVVRDEARDWTGAQIANWAAEVTAKYRPVVEVRNVEASDGGVTVTGEVSGDFPGSPATLRYGFTVDGGTITRLEITA
jgi:hypothetical protein